MAARPCCCCPRGRSWRRGYGRPRSPTWPDTTVSSRSTREATGGRTVPPTQQRWPTASSSRTPLQVLDATGTDQAVLVALSRGNTWALRIAADHPSRVLGWVAIGPFDPRPQSTRPGRRGVRQTLRSALVSPTGWELFNRHEWLHRYRRFVEFFFARGIARAALHQAVGGRRRLGDGHRRGDARRDEGCAEDEPRPVEEVCALVRCPVIVVHGTHDGIIPYEDGRRLAELTGATARHPRGRRAPASGAIPCGGQPPGPRVRRGPATEPTTRLRWRRSLIGGLGSSTSPQPSGWATPAATSRSSASCANDGPTYRSTGSPSTP